MARRKDATPAAGRRRLGRGLESLISAPVVVEIPAPSETEPPAASAPVAPPAPAPSPASQGARVPVTTEGDRPTVELLALTDLRPAAAQPRRTFDPGAMEALARSIRTDGVMQPIVVRPLGKGGPGGYEIVAGERRWRAAGTIGLERIPAVIREMDDRTAARLSLVENLQREDLDPMERAEAFRRLIEEFDLTHQEIADHVGLDRTSITNHLRLLDLDETTQQSLRTGDLSMGHGRALLAITNLDNRNQLALACVKGGWSVRELERRVRSARPPKPTGPTAGVAAHPHMRDLERRLGDHLGGKVRIQPGRKKGAGTLTFAFYSLDEFEGLMQRLGFDSDPS